MSVNAMGNVTSVTESYSSYATTKADTSSKADTSAKTEDTEAAEKAESSGVVYEKSEGGSGKATYSVNKMSAEDRAALVQQLKADQESRQNQLMELVQKTIMGQATTFANANDIWQFLAKGDYTVDEATKLQAQQDISEDGYYGIKQTSERLFDFASALAGDDVDKMNEMHAAMQKGFKQATAAWGRELPEISQKTLDAANKLFEDYYASKESSSTIVE